MSDRPRVIVLGTGGTISHVAAHALDFVDYPDGNEILQADELCARVLELQTIADVIPVRFRAISSTAMGPAEWLELVATIEAAVQKHAPVDGVVVTHGTATLEETAYFLNLTLRIAQTVVIVGAQRPFGSMSSDAPLNLLNAVRVASARAANGLGVLVVLNDEIQAAREVSKSSTYRLETFRSPDVGMLGYADADGRVAIYRAPVRSQAPNTPFDMGGLTTLPRVDITYGYGGADGVGIDAFAAAGARAIVSAGLPAGLLTPGEREALERARDAGVLVVQCSRAGSGRVIPRTALRAARMVAADNLNPQKARILAMLALTRTSDVGAVQRYFDEY